MLPTCIRDHQPAPEEVEGPIGHVAGAAGQGAEVVLGGEAGDEVLRLRGGRAVVQRVAATAQWAEQVPVGELELGAGPILPGTQTALVGGGGGAEVWLDGEQMGLSARIKMDSEWHRGRGVVGAALCGQLLAWRPPARVRGGGVTPPALLGLMLTGWKPEVRMDESATSESSPSFLRQYTRMRTSSSKRRHTATAMRPT